MNKVKIVQIATALSENESWSEYLDDKGRVWYQSSVYNRDENGDRVPPFYKWEQVELPDEPEVTK